MDEVDIHHQDPPSCLIKRLPLELLLQITSSLPTRDLGHMRLTCRAIENMLLNTFAEEFFSRKQFMLSFFSLNALIDISKSRMGRRIRRLQFGTDALYEDVVMGRSNLTELYTAQSEFLHTGVHRDMLVEALRHLENLEDVVIRSFNSYGRTRDGPQAPWRSYGATTAERETGRPVRMEYYRPGELRPIMFSHLLFNSLLDALGAAGSRPTGIEIMGRGAPPLGDGAFALTPALRPSVPSMLHGLEKLHLHVEIRAPGRPVPGTGADKDKARHSNILPWFLTHTPNLKNLRINGKIQAGYELEVFLKWLGELVSDADSGPVPERDHGWPPPVALPKLEELSLGHMVTCYTVALRVIRKFAPTLKRLELWRFTLRWVDEELPSGLATDSSGTAPVLRPFLSSLLDIPVDLRHIMMGYIKEEWRVATEHLWPWPQVISDVSLGRGHPDCVAYTGSDWKPFIRELLTTFRTAPIVQSTDMGAANGGFAAGSFEEDSEMDSLEEDSEMDSLEEDSEME
ncbi:hypothetical protein ACRE_076170 [Hapsidospora chrysogenum ATCC 11550]|uniref:F-box domain-containing protein n=1 Tax=Hapsidospora chrysogenum (strain ATCC 11550 / CBS 779.69 / DSM 880 / IAM 14645 / JCM 23072 / IMI 49137) TaxID=857340 RepID=A0A086SX27_HAPC1|nr:hypothetical protein ACRE_076170 [Hapsidospora chrysogenum ATCC 11550]